MTPTLASNPPLPPPSGRMMGGATLPGDPPEFQRFISGSAPIALDDIEWDAIPRHPLSADVLRIVTYMQDVESHTVVFPRTIFSQQAVNDEIIGTFLICWLYEEGMHGRALARFLDCAGHPVPARTRQRTTLMDHVDRTLTTVMAAAWKDFLALHMAWGAVHECTTIHAYRRLMALNDHPVLNELLRRIVYDEARHFSFYMWQAEQRLARQVAGSQGLHPVTVCTRAGTPTHTQPGDPGAKASGKLVRNRGAESQVWHSGLNGKVIMCAVPFPRSLSRN